MDLLSPPRRPSGRRRPASGLAAGLATTLLVAAAGCSRATEGGPAAGPGPTVLAASSLTDVFTELAGRYEQEHPGEHVTLSFAASSSVREQVLAGAPADVVALADDGMGAELYSAGALAEHPVPFARNEIVIAVPEDNPEDVQALADLDRDGLLVGVCAAQVPCGALARQVVDHAGLDIDFTSHEPNARSLLTRIEERELDVGLVYRTDARARPTVDEVSPADLPSGPDLTAVYTLAPLDSDSDSGDGDGDPTDPATAFTDLVLSPAGREILTDAGFLPAPIPG